MCDLHTNVVSTDSLITYWDQLHAEHRAMLFSLPRHDFETELESCCSCAPLPWTILQCQSVMSHRARAACEHQVWL